ncbi:DNA sulfur modification protein DndB [Chromobacterium haemolyticum]|uniref:DNA sulfur modification protein DndB n=1 Tax=Chromobacterium haemolyticum TaxID=394935 RepID=UPI00244C1E3B|nr:DNA sulfur modification protein DndB [Chromobacterium haemolyticum]MDH0341995.1 DNA sulfur modification protein DndB [Chromobacterium haemolyticum]
MKNYVIALLQTFAQKRSYEAGEIVGTYHADSYAASNRASALNRYKGSRRSEFFGVIQSEEIYKKGEIKPELVEEWHRRDFDERAMYAMEMAIRPEVTGEAGDDKSVSYYLAELGLTLEELRERYEERARASLAEKIRSNQEHAAKKARMQASRADLAKARQEITYTFPAVRGIQAGREYYVAQVPYGVLAKLFVFDEEDVVPAEHRAQRVLNQRRAQDICEYVIANPDDYVLPALTASVSAEMAFEPQALPGASDRVGTLHIPMDATMLINDGQHRRRGIELAIAQRPTLRNETIAVTIYFDRGLERCQQMFADINNRQVKPSSSINALYDRRNPFNAWVLSILDRLPEIKRRVDFENVTPGAKSHKLWSLVTIKRFVTLLTGCTEKNLAEIEEEKRERFFGVVERFFAECRRHIPQWAAMMDGHVAASEVREQWVIGHAVWLEALALFGRQLLGRAGEAGMVDWSPMARLELVDPLKTSRQWEGRCVILGKMQKTSDGIKSTAVRLMVLTGVSVPTELWALGRQLEEQDHSRLVKQ